MSNNDSPKSSQSLAAPAAAATRATAPANTASNALSAFLHQRPSLSLAGAAATVTLDRESNEQAQALLRHHEDQLRKTRLLLERQQLDGNLQQHPLIMASNAMAQAKAVQASILLGGTHQVQPGAAAVGTAFPSSASTVANIAADEKLAQMVAAQQQVASVPGASGAGQLKSEILSVPVQREGEGNLKLPAVESEDDDEGKDHDVDDVDADIDDEGYDDKLTDEEYFGSIKSDDDNRLIQETFPLKLFRMLYEVEKSGKQNIVSFLPHGKAFVVHKPKAFVEEIMPKYFTTCRLASFQRQLNLYGFRRITDGREKGAYSHEYFVKGKRALCRKVKRQKTRVKVAAQHNSFAALASLAAPSVSHPFLGLTNPSMVGLPGSLAATTAAARANLNLGLMGQTPFGGLGGPASALLGSLSTNSLTPAAGGLAAAGAVGDLGFNVLQEALRRGLLTDVQAARQHHGNSSTNNLLATNQELQKRLQEQEAQLILQRMRQQQQDRNQRDNENRP